MRSPGTGKISAGRQWRAIVVLLCFTAMGLLSCTDTGTVVPPPPPPPPPVSNFFQTLAPGDTLLWDYSDAYNSMYGGYMYVGEKRWKVAAIDSSSSIRTTRIEELFTGTKHTYLDSLKIMADTSYVTITEDANHTITVGFYGRPTFNRFYPSSVGDTVKVIGNHCSVMLLKDVGLVSYYYFEHLTAGSVSGSYDLVH